MTLLDRVRQRFARPPEPVRVAVLASDDADERVLAWGPLAREQGWLVATSRGLRVVPPEVTTVAEAAAILPWHEIGSARWTAGQARSRCSSPLRFSRRPTNSTSSSGKSRAIAGAVRRRCARQLPGFRYWFSHTKRGSEAHIAVT